MNDVQKNELKQKILNLLKEEINVKSELKWHEIAEDVIDDVQDSIVVRLSELRDDVNR